MSAAMVYRVKYIGIPPHLVLRKPDVLMDTIGRYPTDKWQVVIVAQYGVMCHVVVSGGVQRLF
jgi:hypothetical protein